MHKLMSTLIFLFNLMTKDSFKLDHLAVKLKSWLHNIDNPNIFICKNFLWQFLLFDLELARIIVETKYRFQLVNPSPSLSATL